MPRWWSARTRKDPANRATGAGQLSSRSLQVMWSIGFGQWVRRRRRCIVMRGIWARCGGKSGILAWQSGGDTARLFISRSSRLFLCGSSGACEIRGYVGCGTYCYVTTHRWFTHCARAARRGVLFFVCCVDSVRWRLLGTSSSRRAGCLRGCVSLMGPPVAYFNSRLRQRHHLYRRRQRRIAVSRVSN